MRRAVNARLSTLLARLETLLPRPRDLLPAVVGALVGLLPLAGLRGWVAYQLHAGTRVEDLWRVQLGDLEFWSLCALGGAVMLRVVPDRAHVWARALFHGFCAFMLVGTVLELVFLAVTGSRADWDMLLFAWRDLEQVLPVFLSEVKPLHVAGLVAAVSAAFAPMFLRAPGGPAWAPRACVAALLVPAIWLEGFGRPVPAKPLRLAQASLIENLYWDGIDRLGDKTIPPPAEELVPVRVARAADAPRPPNVVLVLLESTGADDTSLFDAKLDTTPTLARLAAEGLSADRHTTVVPHTSKSVVSTLCGQFPLLRTDIDEARPGGLPGRCLPELLEDLGYRTAFLQTANDGFERRGELIHRMGFDFFRGRDALVRGSFQKVNYFGWEDRAMLRPGVDWASADPDRPFFQAWLTLTSHHDYKVPSTFEKRAGYPGRTGRGKDHLDAVRYVDTWLGELLDAYRNAGLLEDTVFIVQGDHGEAFGEHGRSQHDLVIWEEGLHVPLVLWGAPLAGRTGTIEGPRQAIDVLPTVLELVGATVEEGYLPGTSLLQPVEETRALYHSCWRSHRCLSERIGDDKVIDHYRERAPQAFRLDTDPRERTDRAKSLDKELLATRVERARTWRARVNGRWDALSARWLAAMPREDDAPAVATFGGQVEALGCTPESGPTVVRGEEVWVRCRWRARPGMESAWKAVFRIEGGFTGVEDDFAPVDGLLPTFRWPIGKVVEDTYHVRVPAFARAGSVTLKVGWSRYGGARIARDDGGEWLEAGKVTVVLPPPALPSAAKAVPAVGAAADAEPSDDGPPEEGE
jgi:lipoteichoic acid synthase